MNGFMLHVEIRGQGSEPGCSATLKPQRHTDAFKMASLHLSAKIKKNVETKGRWNEELGDNWTGWGDLDDRREG